MERVPPFGNQQEDGESAGEWYIYDNDPPEASVTSVWDEERRSNVIRCQGSAEAGGFIIGDRYDVNPNDEDWNETRRVVSFWYKNGFDKIIFYVSISGGYQYRVQYRASHGTSGYNGSGWVTIYLGPEVCSSAWQRFERNIEEDWETYAPPELSWWNTDGMIVWPKGGDYSYLTFIDDIRFSNSKTVQFNALRGGSIGQIAAEYTLGDFPSQTVKWLHYDRLGNVMNKSGSAGTLTDTYHQDAYGNVLFNVNTGQWASSSLGRHLTTKEFDGDANLYYFWQRWYDPRVGRFISIDPMDELNQFLFCVNNPEDFVDPTGLDDERACLCHKAAQRIAPADADDTLATCRHQCEAACGTHSDVPAHLYMGSCYKACLAKIDCIKAIGKYTECLAKCATKPPSKYPACAAKCLRKLGPCKGMVPPP